MKIIIILVTLLMALSAQADQQIPNLTPCLKQITVDEKIVRMQLPMTPFRGLNIILPFKLHDSAAVYSLSSDRIFDYKKAADTNIVSVYFKQFDASLFGTSADLTIAQDGFIFSFTLVALPEGHCSNYQFALSNRLQVELEQEKTAGQEIAFESVYQRKLEELDNSVDEKVLSVIGQVVSSKKKSTNIYEEEKLTLDSGQSLVLLIKKVERYGPYSVIKAQLENRLASRKELTISSVALHFGDATNDIPGKPSYERFIKSGKDTEITFSTLEAVPATGARMIVTTDQGALEVRW